MSLFTVTMLSPSQSPADCIMFPRCHSGPDSALTDIINTLAPAPTPEWPEESDRALAPAHRMVGPDTDHGGDVTIQPPALRTQEELGAKTENSLQLKLTLNKLYHNSSCHKRPILEGYLSSNSPHLNLLLNF